MLEAIGFFIASFFYVGLLGIQTKTVMNNQYTMAFITSLFITTANYFVVNNAASNGYVYFIITSGLGAALGISCSIILHGKISEWFEKKKK